MLSSSGLGQRALFVAVLMAGTCLRLPAQTKPFDGVWWMASTAAEQEGFTFGYGDCFADPSALRVRMLTDDATLRIAVSDYFQSHEAKRTRPVAEVLKEIWSGHLPVRGEERAQPGEGWRDRHGFFDGAWWKGSNPVERLGFVEGYTTCVNEPKNKSRTLQLTPAQYVQWVDRWYTITGDDEVTAQRQAVKVADVLMRVGNHPSFGAQ